VSRLGTVLPVAEASGAPVLHDQGPHRPAGRGKPIQACDQSTTCLQSQIGRDLYLGTG
jgi:hypothetical protein